jgi:hypothetical protein
MTILHKPLKGGATGWLWHRFGDRDQAVRYTEAWEHENFAEEQARWERSDPEYARICDEVRAARKRGGEASLRADEVKAEWDARVATERQASDDSQRAQHALEVDQMAGCPPATSRTVSSHHMHATFPNESNASPAPGIMPEPVRVYDEPAAMTAPRGERPAAWTRFRDRLRNAR